MDKRKLKDDIGHVDHVRVLSFRGEFLVFKIRIHARNNMCYWIRYQSSSAISFTLFE